MALPVGWLREPTFDIGFVLGPAAVALFATAFAMLDISFFVPILMLDVWLLGAHHVVATYTRLCFDRESFRQHRFLVLVLPFIVFGGTLAMVHGVGVWMVTSLYLYWQWFHYTAQSWGVSQVYRRKSGLPVPANMHLAKATFYLLPLWGILYRSWQAPEMFLGQELRVIPVPRIAVDVVATMAIVALGLWVLARIRDAWNKRLPVAHTLYMSSHIAIFAIGYLLIDDITLGWLVINIWHNAQYVLFVWMFNTKRFEGGIDEKARLLSYLSQPKHWWLYFGVCLALSTVLYKGIEVFQEPLVSIGLPLLVFYQTLNFHHYIVDGRIWKMRKPALQKTLGLSAS
ncbi:MAG: hypothetical protein WCF10_03165 [Polyangiales bacterium]